MKTEATSSTVIHFDYCRTNKSIINEQITRLNSLYFFFFVSRINPSMNAPGMPNIKTGNKKIENHKIVAPKPIRVKRPHTGMENTNNGYKRNLIDLTCLKCSLKENIKYTSPGVINAKCRYVIQVSGVVASLKPTGEKAEAMIRYNQVIDKANNRFSKGDLKGDKNFLNIIKFPVFYIITIFKCFAFIIVWPK